MSNPKPAIIIFHKHDRIVKAEELRTINKAIVHTRSQEMHFAQERLQLHEALPNEGVNIETFKKYIAENMDFRYPF